MNQIRKVILEVHHISITRAYRVDVIWTYMDVLATCFTARKTLHLSCGNTRNRYWLNSIINIVEKKLAKVG